MTDYYAKGLSAERLLGEIDYRLSGDGTIACKDGFRSGRLLPVELEDLSRKAGMEPVITEVDKSSVFLEVVKPVASD